MNQKHIFYFWLIVLIFSDAFSMLKLSRALNKKRIKVLTLNTNIALIEGQPNVNDFFKKEF